MCWKQITVFFKRNFKNNKNFKKKTVKSCLYLNLKNESKKCEITSLDNFTVNNNWI